MKKNITDKERDAFINGVLGSDMPSRWAQEIIQVFSKLYASLPPTEEIK